MMTRKQWIESFLNRAEVMKGGDKECEPFTYELEMRM